MGLRAAAPICFYGLLFVTASAAQAPPSDIRYLSHEDARPVFAALGETLPPSPAWLAQIADLDRGVRARIAEGDETSVVHLLLFGTSFTAEPRVTLRDLAQRDATSVVEARLNDFEKALSRPDANERLLFARRTIGEQQHVRSRMLAMLQRVKEDGDRHERLLREAEALGDPNLQFAERSRLYRARGLSSDTSFRTNLALEEALDRLRAGGVLNTGIQRAAIVGPGLDFVDKQEGHDFYPPQTIQPFAVMDSLLRLGLAKADDLHVTTLDLSPSVNDHLARARREAGRGAPYLIHVPLDAHVRWSPAVMRYWEAFGDRIGSVGTPAAVPGAAGTVQVRAVRVRPPLLERVMPRDVNIVAQHLELSPLERFDLVIGTNVFVYYDRPEQALAMANLARMVKPGGILLSNNALVELPSTGWRSIGYSKTLYSDRDEDGDTIVWYQLASR